MKTVLGKRTSSKWKIAVANSFEEIEASRPMWEQMQRDEPHLILLNMLQKSLICMDNGLKFIAKKTGIEDRVKRTWRDVLRKMNSTVDVR